MKEDHLTDTQTQRKARARRILRVLKKLYPDAKMALKYDNNWELLVSVVLSAQCTDKKVNEVTARLFRKYRTLDDYVNADPKAFAQDIRPTGFYQSKTKNILAAAQMLKTIYKSELPRTMDEITKLPGVGRKSANVILGNAYSVVDGVAVDTHVKRFAQKFDLTDYTDPKRIERDLMKLLPKDEWFDFTYRLIEYGRHICPARRHDCSTHPLTTLYPSAASKWPRAR